RRPLCTSARLGSRRPAALPACPRVFSPLPHPPRFWPHAHFRRCCPSPSIDADPEFAPRWSGLFYWTAWPAGRPLRRPPGVALVVLGYIERGTLMSPTNLPSRGGLVYVRNTKEARGGGVADGPGLRGDRRGCRPQSRTQ